MPRLGENPPSLGHCFFCGGGRVLGGTRQAVNNAGGKTSGHRGMRTSQHRQPNGFAARRLRNWVPMCAHTHRLQGRVSNPQSFV